MIRVGRLIVNYLFAGRGEERRTAFVNSSSATALLAVALGRPVRSVLEQPRDDSLLEIFNDPVKKDAKLDAKKKPTTATVIADPALFEAVMIHIPFNFTPEATKCVVNYLFLLWKSDPRFSKELMDSKRLLQLIFDLSERCEEPALAAMQCGLVPYLIDNKFPALWSLIKPSLPHQVLLISAAAKHLLSISQKIPEKQLPLWCLELANVLEDSLLHDHAAANSPEFLQSLAGLTFIVDKADFLYVTVPAFPAFDRRLLEQTADNSSVGTESRYDVAREGGLLRIILKLLFMCISKGNASVSAGACGILRYVMFRDWEQRTELEKLAQDESETEGKTKPTEKKPAGWYNLVDLWLKKDPAKAKAHAARNELFVKRAVKVPFLDSLRGSKGTKKCPKEESLFDQGSLIMAYILGEVFKVLHFELLGIKSYSELPHGNTELRTRLEAADSDSASAPRVKMLLGVLWELARRYGSEESGLHRVFAGDFAEVLLRLRGKMLAYCNFRPSPAKDLATVLAKGSAPQLVIKEVPSAVTTSEGSMKQANGLDDAEEGEDMKSDTPRSEEIAKLVLSSPVEESPNKQIGGLVEETKVISPKSPGVGELSFGPQDAELTELAQFWGIFVKSLLDSLAPVDSADKACNVAQALVLNANYIQVFQRFIHVCASHQIARLDNILSSTLAIPRSSVRLEPTRVEERGIYRELETRVRDKFCYLGVHKEKIGIYPHIETVVERDEMRTDFEVLGGSIFTRLVREQELEVNPWHNKKQERYNQTLFECVERRYQALLNRCPLHRQLAQSGRAAGSSTKRFVELLKSRDQLGRRLKFREMCHIEENGLALNYNFGYLRWGTLKKFLVMAVAPESSKAPLRSPAFLGPDFTFKLQQNLFRELPSLSSPASSPFVPRRQGPESSRKSSGTGYDPRSYSEEGSVSELGSDVSASVLFQDTSVRQFIPHGDYIPKSSTMRLTLFDRGEGIRCGDDHARWGSLRQAGG